MSAGIIILILKLAVGLVTVLLCASLIAVYKGNYTLHGRINLAFFVLTLIALLGLEVVVRIISPELFADHFRKYDAVNALNIHLGFAMPAAVMMPFMLFSGLKRHRAWHLGMSALFLILWTGTFVTGIFYLPIGQL